MKGRLLLLLAVGLALALASCEIAGGPTEEEALSDEVVAQAAAEAMEVANLAVAARSSGDYSGLNDYLGANDPDGEILATLEKHGMLARAPTPRGVGNLPPFDGSEYENGDVLVCKGSSSGISNLMELILVRGYGHAGILNKALAGTPAGCVLSADIDYLTAPEAGKYALTYETYEGWRDSNDTVTVLRTQEGIPNLSSDPDPIEAFFTAYNRGAGTVYAFFGYPGIEYGAFVPIPREDSKYWYCSKTAWRVLYEATGGAVSSEQSDFYFVDGKWKVLKESLLYDLLRIALFTKSYKWWQWWGWFRIEPYAEAVLKAGLVSLITPDELRAWDGFDYAQPYGDVAYDSSVWVGYEGY